MTELFEMESLQEYQKQEYCEAEKRIHESLDQLEKAIQNGNVEAACFYLGELSDLCKAKDSDEKSEAVGEISFGSKEKDDLERKLSTAESNYRHAERALKDLLRDKAKGWKGVDSAISNREYQVKTYAREIANLKREISRIKE